MDTLKQGQKTIVPEKCEIHDCNLEQIILKDDGWHYACPQCKAEKDKSDMLNGIIFRAHSGLNLPARFKDCSFANYKATGKALSNRTVCEKYVAGWPQSGGGLMLGGVGTGKTHLATAICRSLCDKGISCKMTNVNQIVRDIRSTWGNGRKVSGKWEGSETVETEADVIRNYNNYELLVIDEIGSQYGTDSERIIINEIINNRYERMLPTIVIGNLSVSETKDIIGERVVDRLKHGGFLLIFDWESNRK